MTTVAAVPRVPTVGQERKKPDEKQVTQVTFRISSELHSRLDAAAEGLELDISSLLRTMIREHLPTYEDRAAAIRLKEQREGH